jgi:hypothetical protein
MRTTTTLFLGASLLLLPGSGLAQTLNAIVPKAYATGGNRQTQVPFAMQPLRWQQVYFGKEMGQDIKSPVRIRGVRFRSAQTGNSGANLDLEARMGHLTTYASSTFDDNLKSATLVLARRTITMPTSTALAWDIVLPFDKDFTWDGKNDVVIEVKIWSNSRGNAQFLYFLDQVIDLSVGIETLYAINPLATTAAFRQSGNGLPTRFDYETGTVLNYGAGCRGEGNVVPRIGSTGGLPVVGNINFRLTLAQAKVQAPCALLWGGSNTQWGPVPLPFDLAAFGIHGCTLLADPLFLFPAMTSGGSPGSGQAEVPFGIPASGLFKGIVLYAQWLVVDPTITARLHPLAFSDGVHIIIG